jgi:hypothetical protein
MANGNSLPTPDQTTSSSHPGDCGFHPGVQAEPTQHQTSGISLLRAENLRAVNAPGKHRVVLESLEGTLGTPPDLIAYFQQLRDLRHRDIYEGSIHVSEREAEDAVIEASGLLERLRTWLEAGADKS